MTFRKQLADAHMLKVYNFAEKRICRWNFGNASAAVILHAKWDEQNTYVKCEAIINCTLRRLAKKFSIYDSLVMDPTDVLNESKPVNGLWFKILKISKSISVTSSIFKTTFSSDVEFDNAFCFESRLRSSWKCNFLYFLKMN